MTSNINEGKGITITRDQVSFPDVNHKFRLDYKGREAYLCVNHVYETGSADYSVYAHVEMGDRECHEYDHDVDGSFTDNWQSLVYELFHGCFMQAAHDIELPQEFVEMIERLLGDLAFLFPVKDAV